MRERAWHGAWDGERRSLLLDCYAVVDSAHAVDAGGKGGASLAVCCASAATLASIHPRSSNARMAFLAAHYRTAFRYSMRHIACAIVTTALACQAGATTRRFFATKGRRAYAAPTHRARARTRREAASAADDARAARRMAPRRRW